MSVCDLCKKREVKVTLSSDGFQEKLCRSCYNEIIAEELGVTLEETPETMTAIDDQGVTRIFAVEARLDPVGIFFEAVENIDYGYEFAVYGALDCKQSELYQQLVDKVNRGVQTRYIHTAAMSSGQSANYIPKNYLVGRLEYDENNESVPMTIIDGKPYTWDELGRLLGAYEGFQFKLKLSDLTDEE